MQEADRQALAALMDQVEQWAAEQESLGKSVNLPLFYVGEALNYVLSVDPEGKDPDLMRLFDAGVEYYEACRAAQAEQGALVDESGKESFDPSGPA